MQILPQLRLFSQRHLLQRPALGAVRDAHRAIHVSAAQHDHATRRATEEVHQRFRLRTRADDQVDHDFGSEALQLLSGGVELVTVASNLDHARGYLRRAAVKHRHRVSSLSERRHDEPPDETIPPN